MQQVKQAAVRGGAANLTSQAVCAGLRIGAMVVLARLLTPDDFGLVAMITSVVGILNLFKDFGLSTATVQRASITDAELSTLFWINVLIGVALTLAVVACAKPLAIFYKDDRLFLAGVVLAINFLINALGIQHSALLQRQMRFTLLAAIEAGALAFGLGVAILLGNLGAGYWALVGMTLASIATQTAAAWMASGWKPSLPRRGTEVRPLLKIGGVVTVNAVVMYCAYNLEKVLIGRFLGAATLGMYGRAQQLINFPTDSLNSAVGSVLVSALSRVKERPEQWKSYFLKGYSLLVSVTFPVTIIFALYADDLVAVLLGPKWMAAAPILRALSPATLVLGMINPMWPLLVSLGLMTRSLKMALVLAPIIVVGYSVGLHWGTYGVALGLSTALSVWAIPHLCWTVHGTPIRPMDIANALARPLIACLVAAVVSIGITTMWASSLIPVVRLMLGAAVFAAIYSFTLLRALRQWPLYAEVLATLRLKQA